MSDYIKTEKVLDLLAGVVAEIIKMPPEELELVRCKDCKYWERQTTYQGVPFSWGHCESEHMWDSLYGETYEVGYIETNEEHFCGYAERISE